MAIKVYLNSVPASGAAPVTGTCRVQVTCSSGDLSYALNSGKYYVAVYADGSLLRSSITNLTGSSATSITVTTGSITLSDPGTYSLVAYLTDSSGKSLGYSSGSRSVTVTGNSYETTINYYGHGQKLATVYVDGGDDHTVRSYTYSGWTLSGYASRTSSTSIAYDVGDTITASTSGDATINLYAVYYNESTINCYYGVNKGGSGSPNKRTKRQYMVNTSATGTNTNIYDNINLPEFSAANSTVTTLNRTWTVIGWRTDTEANDYEYGSGVEIAVKASTSDFYAVYKNTDGIKVTYNANGGSGSMASATVAGALYYNTNGNNSQLTVTPRSCTFTPPTGKQFKGWSTTASGDIVTSVKTVYNLTFYAQWESARPDDWEWSGYLTLNGTRTPYNMVAGGQPPMVQQSDGTYYAYYMGASEWNNFRARIQKFADYLGVSLSYLDINGSSVSAGQKMMKSEAQCVVNMLNALDPPTAPPTVTNSISVRFFTGIRDSLNSIK